MDTVQQITDAIAKERASGLNVSEAEVLRYAVWAVWADRVEALGLEDAAAPTTMTSSEWADACATLGIQRGTAMNRYSEAKRNWCFG
jgi:hypothetical protein